MLALASQQPSKKVAFKLIPSVKRGKWREKAGVEPSADEDAFVKVRPKVLARDKHKCQSCELELHKLAEVHHVDDCHANNVESNLITLCSVCHAWNHIGFLGDNATPFASGAMDELHIEPSEINTLMTACAVVLKLAAEQKNGGDEFARLDDVVSSIMKSINASSGDVYSAWGSNQLKEFAAVLSRSTDEVYESREGSFNGLGVAIKPSVLGGLATHLVSNIGEYAGFLHESNWDNYYHSTFTEKNRALMEKVASDEDMNKKQEFA